ncbi:hypothetical protein JD844_017750 [Phrynosoma platyrhinos]|uniref:Uncharacterized protein n=1 Tax=Phrynosoma platyrhinos TaxID=52577 RepID=A0ABQ7SM98_PHRPL|nr:hypothetical protein JD844_017750 [Phrynosoma platyrhinos]
MKTLVRHGLAVSFALTTMCTSLLLLYGSIIGRGEMGRGGGGGEGGGQKEQSQQQQQQQQVAVTASQKPVSPPQLRSPSQRHLPGLSDRPLEGYIGVLDHKVSPENNGQSIPLPTPPTHPPHS